MKKSLLISLLVLLLTMGMALTISAQEGDFRLTWWGGQTRHDQTFELIEMFEEQNPGINVEPHYTSWGGYWDVMYTQAAADNLPDAFQHVRRYLGTWVAEDRLLDLQPYVDDGSLNLNDIPAEVIDSGRYDGKLVGIPTGVNALAVIYNKALLEEAGIETPIDPEWTWEEYLEIARTVNEETGVYASNAVNKVDTVGSLQIYLRQHGKALINEEGDGLGYDDDDLFAEWLNLDIQLMEEGVIPSTDVRMEWEGEVENHPVTDGRAAMAMTHWSNQFTAIYNGADEDIKENLAMTVIPNKKAQRQPGLFVKPAMLWTVSANAENPEAAIEWLNFYNHDVEAHKLMRGERGIPISNVIRGEIADVLTEADQVMFDYLNLAEEMAGPSRPEMPEAFEQIGDVLEEVCHEVLFGYNTPEMAAYEFRMRVEALLQ